MPTRRERTGLPLPVRVALLEREVDELRRDLEQLDGQVEAMSVEDRIRSGVRKELAARSPAQAEATAVRVSEKGAPIILTTWQKVGGAIGGLVLLLDAVRGFVG